MKIELSYNDDQARKLFESFGFQVITDQVKFNLSRPHGMEAAIGDDHTQLVVINPVTQAPILLCTAMQRLFQHKMLTDMYYIDKMAALDALNCREVKDSFADILNQNVKPTNKQDNE